MPTLPGIRTILRDRFAALGRSNDVEGSRIVLLARRGNTATSDYPDYEPYRAVDEANVITGFSEDSECHRGYLELVAAGANNIYIIPIPDDTITTDTTSSNSLYQRLESSAYPSAETIEPEIMIPYGRGAIETFATPDDTDVGASADNSATASENYAVQLAKWCAQITLRSAPVLGVIGLTPFASTNPLKPTTAEVSTGLAYSNLIGFDDAAWTQTVDDVEVQTGRFISIVAGEPRNTFQKHEWGFSGGATTYAGLLSTLAAESAPTNKTLFNVTELRWSPTRAQAETLAVDKQLVPFGLDFTRTPIVIDSPTYAPTGSDYGRVSTMRIVLDAVNLVRITAKRFVGESATHDHRNALETGIRAQLQGMRTAGALLDYDFLVTYFSESNKAVVDLILRPAFEIREIKVQVQIEV